MHHSRDLILSQEEKIKADNFAAAFEGEGVRRIGVRFAT
jgi:hypothetical protein